MPKKESKNIIKMSKKMADFRKVEDVWFNFDTIEATWVQEDEYQVNIFWVRAININNKDSYTLMDRCFNTREAAQAWIDNFMYQTDPYKRS
jgi:hypothetical protein